LALISATFNRWHLGFYEGTGTNFGVAEMTT